MWWKSVDAPTSDGAVTMPVTDWLLLHILLREADALIRHEPVFPADPVREASRVEDLCHKSANQSIPMITFDAFALGRVALHAGAGQGDGTAAVVHPAAISEATSCHRPLIAQTYPDGTLKIRILRIFMNVPDIMSEGSVEKRALFWFIRDKRARG